MEELKPFEEILRADFRSACRGYTLDVLYQIAAAHELTPAVPEDVRHQFEIARHAYIYAGLYTPLCAAAELYTALAVEHALRLRYAATETAKRYPCPSGLKQLLKIAIAERWITDDGFDFEHLELVLTEDSADYREVPPERRKKHTDIILDTLPSLRNSMAHGQPTMTLEKTSTFLQRAAEIINQLFPASSTTERGQ